MEKITRRRFLASAGTVGLLSVAGCLGPDREQIEPVAALPAPTRGDPSAAVTIDAYKDYTCPACGAAHNQLYPRLKDEFLSTGEVEYRFNDFPLPHNRFSVPAANIARAAQDRVDEDAFWTVHNRVYDNQQDVDTEFLVTVAADVGLEEEFARAVINQRPYERVIERDKEEGKARGVPDATPTYFVNQERVIPRQGLDQAFNDIQTLVNSALRDS